MTTSPGVSRSCARDWLIPEQKGMAFLRHAASVLIATPPVHKGCFWKRNHQYPARCGPWSREQTEKIVWWVSKLDKSFTSPELASQVAIRLVKRYEAYEHASGR